MLRFDISYRSVILLAVMLLSLWALLQLWPIVLSVITAFILMAALLPYADWLARRGLPRTLSVVLILFFLLLVLSGLMYLLVPPLIEEFQNLKDDLPEDARRLEEFLADFGITVQLQERAANFDWGDLLTGQFAFDYGRRIVLTSVSILTVVVLTAYLLVDAHRIAAFLERLVPPERKGDFERLVASLNSVVGGYIRGQLVTSAAISLFTLVLLLALGVPNAVAYAVLAGFLDIIPIIGAFLAVILPAVAAFQESVTRAFIVLIALTAYQQFEDRLLIPRIYAHTLRLPPIVVLIAVLAGGQMFGIPGVLLAIPAAAAGRIFFEYLVERGEFPMQPPKERPFAPDEPSEDRGELEEPIKPGQGD